MTDEESKTLRRRLAHAMRIEGHLPEPSFDFLIESIGKYVEDAMESRGMRMMGESRVNSEVERLRESEAGYKALAIERGEEYERALKRSVDMGLRAERAEAKVDGLERNVEMWKRYDRTHAERANALDVENEGLKARESALEADQKQYSDALDHERAVSKGWRDKAGELEEHTKHLELYVLNDCPEAAVQLTHANKKVKELEAGQKPRPMSEAPRDHVEFFLVFTGGWEVGSMGIDGVCRDEAGMDFRDPYCWLPLPPDPEVKRLEAGDIVDSPVGPVTVMQTGKYRVSK